MCEMCLGHVNIPGSKETTEDHGIVSKTARNKLEETPIRQG